MNWHYELSIFQTHYSASVLRFKVLSFFYRFRNRLVELLASFCSARCSIGGSGWDEVLKFSELVKALMIVLGIWLAPERLFSYVVALSRAVADWIRSE